MELDKGTADNMAEEYLGNGDPDSQMKEEVGQNLDIDGNLGYSKDRGFDMLDA
jgi:hypothetical protein